MTRSKKAPWMKLKWGSFTSELKAFGSLGGPNPVKKAKSLADVLAHPLWAGSSVERVVSWLEEDPPFAVVEYERVLAVGPRNARPVLIDVVTPPSGAVARIKVLE